MNSLPSPKMRQLVLALLAAATMALAGCGADDPSAPAEGAGQGAGQNVNTADGQQESGKDGAGDDGGDAEGLGAIEGDPEDDAQGQAVTEGRGADGDTGSDEGAEPVEEDDPADSSKWEQSTEAKDPDAAQNEAILTVDGKEFNFTLDWCFKSDEDLVAGGPGVADDGTPAFFDIDLYGGMDNPDGEARVDVGSDVKFDSTDEFYAFGTHLSTKYVFSEHAAGWFEFTGDARNQQGDDVGEATVHFSCH